MNITNPTPHNYHHYMYYLLLVTGEPRVRGGGSGAGRDLLPRRRGPGDRYVSILCVVCAVCGVSVVYGLCIVYVLYVNSAELSVLLECEFSL